VFDKTYSLVSSDKSVTLAITAGTEGVIDLLAPSIKEYLSSASPAA
jgi:hypothetical protein